MKRKSYLLNGIIGLVLCLGFGAGASAEPRLVLSPDHFTNTLVVAGESVTQTMIISNTGISDVEFSFCPPPPVEDNGLVASYPFNGNANDESGNGHDGTVNGATLTTDRFGNADSAFYFDGNDYITCGDVLDIKDSSFSIVMWVKASSFDQYAKLINKGQTKFGTPTNAGYSIRLLGGSLPEKEIKFQLRDNAGQGVGAGCPLSQLPAREYVCISSVLERQGTVSTARLFINGQLVASESGNLGYIDTNISLAFGALYRDGIWAITEGFVGDIDDIRIYNRALSESEIYDLYMETPAMECTIPEWLVVEPKSGTVLPGSSMEVAIGFDANGMVAGDYVEHMLDVYSNDSATPIGSVPVSMWVVPPKPIMAEEPPYTAGKSNEVQWLGLDGPVVYLAEAYAIEHCSSGLMKGRDGQPVPKGWSNVQRFYDPDRWMQQSGWISATNHLFSDLHLNTKYQYRVKAAVETEIGMLESAWSDWVESCQVPYVREIDEDKVPGWWKDMYFGNSENFQGLIDSDGDGLCDFDEYVADGNPFDSLSNFRVENCTTCAEGHFIIHWNSAEGRVYSVYWSPSMAEPFHLLESNIYYPQNGYTDSVHNVESGGFYKVGVELLE